MEGDIACGADVVKAETYAAKANQKLRDWAGVSGARYESRCSVGLRHVIRTDQFRSFFPCRSARLFEIR